MLPPSACHRAPRAGRCQAAAAPEGRTPSRGGRARLHVQAEGEEPGCPGFCSPQRTAASTAGLASRRAARTLIFKDDSEALQRGVVYNKRGCHPLRLPHARHHIDLAHSTATQVRGRVAGLHASAPANAAGPAVPALSDRPCLNLAVTGLCDRCNMMAAPPRKATTGRAPMPPGGAKGSSSASRYRPRRQEAASTTNECL